MSKKRNTADYYIKGILAGDKLILSKAITLIESELEADVGLSLDILNRLSTHKKDSIRIGITGVPGVGKSTFIETFGSHLIRLGKKVAVLAIDPTSNKTGGSILGDKTRMGSLSTHEHAFIRPSPTKSTLGGVSNSTMENILLCEAAGYDVVMVETVGVGQSETHVRGIVDFFLLLMLPGAGDELQGIKKGIIELADALVINKADGESIKKAKEAQNNYKNALHLFPPTESGWLPQVLTCSALEQQGIEDIWKVILEYNEIMTSNGFLAKSRADQNVNWFREQISQCLVNKIFQKGENIELKRRLEKKISTGELNPKKGLAQLMDSLFPS